MHIAYFVLLCIILVIITMSYGINASIYMRIIICMRDVVMAYVPSYIICISLFTYIFCSCVMYM